MFTKYINTIGNAEAEWCLEVLDMHGGKKEKALRAIAAALVVAMDHNEKLRRHTAAVEVNEALAQTWVKRFWVKPVEVPSKPRDLGAFQSAVLASTRIAVADRDGNPVKELWATGGDWWWDGLRVLKEKGLA